MDKEEIVNKFKNGSGTATFVSVKDLNKESLFLMFKEIEKNETKSLEIINSNTSKNTLLILSNYLKKNKILKYLDLTLNKIDDFKVSILCDGLKENKFLTSLNLSKNEIKGLGCEKISEMLKENQFLKSLYLNEMSSLDSEVLSEAMLENTTLTYLSLYGCKYKSNFESFFLNLEDNTSLLHLNLGLNEIGSRFNDKYFERYLEMNQTLKTINLMENSLLKFHIQDICKGLSKNKTITSINLSFNELSKNSIQLIADVLKSNSTIKIIDLGYDNISNEMLDILSHSLQENIGLEVINLRGNGFGKLNNLLLSVQNHKKLRLLGLGANSIDDISMEDISNYIYKNQVIQELSFDIGQYSYEGMNSFVQSFLFNYSLILVEFDVRMESKNCDETLMYKTKLNEFQERNRTVKLISCQFDNKNSWKRNFDIKFKFRIRN